MPVNGCLGPYASAALPPPCEAERPHRGQAQPHVEPRPKSNSRSSANTPLHAAAVEYARERWWRGGRSVTLGYFATAEEAALCVARSPEGRAAAAKRGAAV